MTIYQDIPRIYTALAEWIACMVYCGALKRKIEGWQFALASAVFFVIQSVFLVFTRDVPEIFWIPCMAFAVFNMWLFLYIVCDATRLNLIYYLVSAFLLAEFAASFEWQLACFIKTFNQSTYLQVITLLITFFVIYTLVFSMERSWADSAEFFDINRNEALAVVMISVAVFGLSNLSFISENTPFSSTLRSDIFYIRTLVDFAGVIVIYAYKSRISEMNAQKELTSINSMLKEQYDKYRSYQSSFEMINIKYHDLKHQIAGLRGEKNEADREKWISAMEQELETYKPELQTGNHVLDTILSGKMLSCRPHNIKVTCVAEGQLIDFMHVTDICTIFGNALDNAIESVSLIEDPEKRLIHLTVTSQKNFVLIQISNYCEQELNIKDGNLLTTKTDKRNHGYGIKSIKYTVDKYKGNVEYELNKNWFELKIILPKNIA
ncbi:MAG: GHKL domain-containing protein [Butyrivibrio sp.]|nr:GHKL domain-containing protein [Butyrivibrio sp.]